MQNTKLKNGPGLIRCGICWLVAVLAAYISVTTYKSYCFLSLLIGAMSVIGFISGVVYIIVGVIGTDIRAWFDDC
jgi:hypothetical protein